jgi:conjugative relaxase-like TrwC/TraI family protein
MLSIANITSEHASSYYSNGDYYSKDSIIGEWCGKGADKLKLKDKAFDKLDFEKLLNGKSVVDNKEINLSSRKNRAAGIDLTFSAPKSVSIMCELKDKGIEKIQQQAVKNTIEYIESNFVFSRTGGEFKKENSIISTLFRHNTSRELDPQLHTHCVLHNIVFDDKSDKTRTAYFKDIFNNKKFLGAVYRNELAKGLVKAGYELDYDKNKFTFEIKGVEKELIKEFSTRRQQIEEKLKESTSKIIDGKISAQATLLTRKAKVKNINEKLLVADWKDRSREYNLDNLKDKDKASEKTLSLKEVVNKSMEHISERKAVFTKQEVIQEIAKRSLGNFDIKEIEAGLSKTSNIFYNANTREYSTMKQYAREELVVDIMEKGKDKFAKLISFKDMNKVKENSKLLYGSLNKDQQNTVDFILANKDQFIAIQGFAGVGKTYTVKSLNEILEKNNYKMLGLAPTNNATNILKKEANIETRTLQSFLKQYDGYANGRGSEKGLEIVKKEFENTIILLDESSLADTKQIKDLFTIAGRLNTRVILQGDKMQLDSVNAGTPFKQLQDKGIGKVNLENILRQKNLEIKEAVFDITNKDIQNSFKRLDKNIIEIKGAEDTKAEIVNCVVSQYMMLSKEYRQNTLILAPANETRTAINELLRAALKTEYISEHPIKEPSIIDKIKDKIFEKELNEATIKILTQKSLTEVEKRENENYEKNNKLVFSKDYKTYNIVKDIEYKVIDIDKAKNTLTIKDKDNNEIKLNLDKAKNFSVFEENNLPLQRGENLKWTRTIKDQGIIKSNELTLTKITENNLSFHEKSTNRDITLNKDDPLLKSIDYNYATTTYSAQGKTSKHAIVVVESYRTNLTNQKSFYVEVSRVKDDIQIITDDKNKTLDLLIKNTGDKTNAMELFNSARVEKAVNDRLAITTTSKMQSSNKGMQIKELSKDLDYSK